MTRNFAGVFVDNGSRDNRWETVVAGRGFDDVEVGKNGDKGDDDMMEAKRCGPVGLLRLLSSTERFCLVLYPGGFWDIELQLWGGLDLGLGLDLDLGSDLESASDLSFDYGSNLDRVGRKEQGRAAERGMRRERENVREGAERAPGVLADDAKWRSTGRRRTGKVREEGEGEGWSWRGRIRRGRRYRCRARGSSCVTDGMSL
jgi:hypothetical protein